MDTALPQKFPFILDRNLAEANCTGNRVCTSCDTVVLATDIYIFSVEYCFFYRIKKSLMVPTTHLLLEKNPVFVGLEVDIQSRGLDGDPQQPNRVLAVATLVGETEVGLQDLRARGKVIRWQIFGYARKIWLC